MPKISAAAAAKSSGTASIRKGIMMILSPAKTLDLSPMEDLTKSSNNCPEQSKWTQPNCNISLTKEVAQDMKQRSKKDLAKLLGISDKLSQTALEYWKNFQVDDSDNSSSSLTSKPCIYAFSGAAYQGLQIKDCSKNAVLYLQNNLRIIDPLYGVLRPLDIIQPYRLEMASQKVLLEQPKVKLSEYWKDSVCTTLSKDLKNAEDSPILLNLASDEYSAAVDTSRLPDNTQYIKVVFQQEGRVISVHAKRARGLMTRFIAENSIESIEQVQQEFNVEGYTFQSDKSNDSTIVFDRPKDWNNKKENQDKQTTTSAKTTTTNKKKSSSPTKRSNKDDEDDAELSSSKSSKTNKKQKTTSTKEEDDDDATTPSRRRSTRSRR